MSEPVAAPPDLSVLIVSYNTRELLARCLDTLLAAAGEARMPQLEIIVIENGSTDGTVELLTGCYPAVTLLPNATNAGFAAANNQGLALARAPVALLLNSDAFVTAETLRRGLGVLATRPRAGMAGVRLLNADGTTQFAYGTFPTLWSDLLTSVGLDRFLTPARQPARSRVGPVDWVNGACLFVRTAALGDIGPLDEAFFMYSEEVDWCRRCWARGWEVWYAGDAPVTHLGGASSSKSDLSRRIALYRSRLGLRRRLGGSASSAALWLGMLAGLGGRALGRAAVQALVRRRLGRHSPRADWQLVRAVARMDPLARWAAP